MSPLLTEVSTLELSLKSFFKGFLSWLLNSTSLELLNLAEDIALNSASLSKFAILSLRYFFATSSLEFATYSLHSCPFLLEFCFSWFSFNLDIKSKFGLIASRRGVIGVAFFVSIKILEIWSFPANVFY